jgi:lysophospholipase L1-like esterase
VNGRDILAGLVSAFMAAAVSPAAALDGSQCQRVSAEARGAGSLATGALPRTIVAVGSSSTEGIPGNDRSALYPAILEKELSTGDSSGHVRVLNRGKGGEDLPQTLARFDRDVLSAKPDLVIWQLGVNDVLANDGIADRRQLVDEGLARLAKAGVPVVLLDLQYSPRVNQDRDTPAMQGMIAEAAATGPRGRVIHFRRFAAMKALAEKEGVPMSEMIVGDGLHMTDAMHTCVGKLLAGIVTRATGASAALHASR